MRNWSLIAKKMFIDFNLPRKSAKQCKERYYLNNSDMKIISIPKVLKLSGLSKKN